MFRFENPNLIARINQDVGEQSLPPIEKANVGNRPEILRQLRNSTAIFGFPDIWRQTAGSGVKVAVIDSGIDPDHRAFFNCAIDKAVRVNNGHIEIGIQDGEELKNLSVLDKDGQIVLDQNGRELKQNGFDLVRDTNGHGTHCAGIIAARPLVVRNGRELIPYEPTPGTDLWKPCEAFAQDHPDGLSFGELTVPFVGVAPRSKLLIYKVTSMNPEGVDVGEALVSDLALAIDEAVNDGAKLISISMAAEEGSDQLIHSVHRAVERRRTIIVSAGNQGALSTNGIGFPARYGACIAVGSHGRFGNRSLFSSLGGEVIVGAPGEQIWAPWKDRTYRRQSGTSMAAPYICGLCALMLGSHENAEFQLNTRNSEEIREALIGLAAHPGCYDPANLGYGPVMPGHYLGRMPIIEDLT